MAITNGQTATHTDLNSRADGKRATMNTDAQARAKDLEVPVYSFGFRGTGGSATALPLRSRIFRPRVDMEVRAIGVYKNGGSSGSNLTLTVTAINSAQATEDSNSNPFNEVMGLSDPTVTLATAGTGEESARTDYRTTTGTRLWLRAGQRYMLTLTGDSGTYFNLVQGTLYCRVAAYPRAGFALADRIYRDAKTLNPADLNATFDGLWRDLQRAIACRYTYSSFLVPLDDMPDSTDQVQRQIKLNIPLAYDILSVDFYSAHDDNGGGSQDVTLTTTGVTGVDTLTVTNSSKVLYAEATPWEGTVHVAASTEVTFEIGSAGSYDVDAAYAVVHIRHDRHQAAPPSTWEGPIGIASGVPPNASTVASEFDDFDSDANADNTADKQLRVQIVVRRNINLSIAANQRTRLWSSARRLDSMDFSLAWSSAVADLDCAYVDEGAVTVEESTGNRGTGAGILVQDLDVNELAGLPDTQTDDPTTQASDYTVDIVTTNATPVELAYWVGYFT